MRDRGHDIATAGKVFREERVIGEAGGKPRAKYYYGMRTARDGSVPATVCPYLEGPHGSQLSKVVPHGWRGVLCGFAILVGFQGCRIPETDRQLSLGSVVQIRILTRLVGQVHHARANEIGSRRSGNESRARTGQFG